MTPAARLSAAIEVLTDLIERRRPAADALKDWGLSRRFAGSKDRAAVASLVYDALRRKASETKSPRRPVQKTPEKDGEGPEERDVGRVMCDGLCPEFICLHLL